MRLYIKFCTSDVALWTTIAFIILSPFENILRTEQFLYVLCVALLGICVFVRRTIVKNFSLLWMAYMAYAFIACIWSANEYALGTLMTTYAQLLFLILQLQFQYTNQDYERIKKAVILQNWILLVLCFLFGSYKDSRFWLQSSSSGADPNYLSGWFIIPICLAIEYLFSQNTRWLIKGLLIIQIGLSFYYIMQTASKSGLATNAAAVLLSVLFATKKLIKRHPLQALGILGCLIVGGVFAATHMPAYLVYRLLNGSGTLSGRTVMWNNLLNYMLENPLGILFGFGTASVAQYSGTGMVAHNTFLDVQFNFGLIGLSIVATSMFGGIREKWSTRPYVVIALFSMSVLIFTLSAFNTRFFMTLLFLIGADVKKQIMLSNLE